MLATQRVRSALQKGRRVLPWIVLGIVLATAAIVAAIGAPLRGRALPRAGAGVDEDHRWLSSSAPSSSSALAVATDATSEANCMLSLRESLGYFCEPDNQWEARKALVRRQYARQKQYDHIISASHKSYWFVFWRPVVHCQFAERLGDQLDGGRWVCDPLRWRHITTRGYALHRRGERDSADAGRPPRCLVYSFGSRLEFSFEHAVLAMQPECEVHTFDHTVKRTPQVASVELHLWGLGQGNGSHPPLYSLTDIMSKLGHAGRELDMLKLDVEGWEIKALEPLLDAGTMPKVRVLFIEMHYKPLRTVDAHRFFKKLHKAGYHVVSKEPNFECNCCIEFVLQRFEWDVEYPAPV